jgi:anti-sigma B factor antagonist
VHTEVAHIEDVTVVAPAGELDTRTSTGIRDTLTDLVQHGRARLIVDLAQVPYVDSSGLGALVAAMKRARAAGGDLRLCGARHEVKLILETTGLTKQISMDPDRQAAVASWRSSAVGDRLDIDQTQFLVSTKDSSGQWTTFASDVVPLRPGRASYRWKIHLRTRNVASVALTEIVTAPEAPDVWPSGPDTRVADERRTAVTESRADVTDGWVSRGWRVVEGDRPGTYSIDVHVNGALAHRFVFHLR